MIRSVFEDDEIPFEVLKHFGLSQEMIEDLPQNVLSGISDGRRSPVLPICYTCEDGTKVHDRARFSLIRDEETGKVRVMFYPKQTRATLDMFSDSEQALLREGKAIIGTMTTKDGRDVQAFHQLDADSIVFGDHSDCINLFETICGKVFLSKLAIYEDVFYLVSVRYLLQ